MAAMIASAWKAADKRRGLRRPLRSDEGKRDCEETAEANSMETLIAEGIGKSYKGRQVVRGVDLKISRGEVVGLLGPNGAGKTTCFYIIVGLITPDGGRVLVDETEITQTP